MPLKELRNMEGKVEKAISRIRTKKVISIKIIKVSNNYVKFETHNILENLI